MVWLVYGVLSCLVIWPDTLAFLFPEAFAGWDPTTGLPRVLSALLPWQETIASGLNLLLLGGGVLLALGWFDRKDVS